MLSLDQLAHRLSSLLRFQDRIHLFFLNYFALVDDDSSSLGTCVDEDFSLLAYIILNVETSDL